MEPIESKKSARPTAHAFGKLIIIARYLAVRAVETGLANLDVVRREAALFGGLALAIIGVFSFHAGRYCDGNTADYLSCTRPAVYYYYGVFEIVLIVAGASLIGAWVLRRANR